MNLYIAEKPDVGRVLADYLSRKCKSASKREKGYFLIPGEGVVTWAVGHMLEQADMDYYLKSVVPASSVKNNKVKWSSDYLPFIPERFVMLPSMDEGKSAQLKVIGKLMGEASAIYHSADRDREGQAIVDEMLANFKITGKKVRRIVFSALDDHSIDAAFRAVGDNSDPKYQNMWKASKARAMADWTIGLNATRACTVLHSAKGVISVGRVQTPTLAIIVARSEAIENFKPVAFYQPQITLADGTVLTWRSRSDGNTAGIDAEGRITDRGLAESIVDAINKGLAGTITDASSTKKKQPPPLPYSLPALQAEMSKRHGLSVEETTQACQSLYNKKMQSYVGTDCRYLPESMRHEATGVVTGLRGQAVFKKAAETANLDIRYKCWDDSKISAHHAIIPTGEKGSFENDAEKQVYESVSRRYLAQFHPEYCYLKIRIEAIFGSDSFSASHEVPVSMGWKSVDMDSSDESADADKNSGKDSDSFCEKNR